MIRREGEKAGILRTTMVLKEMSASIHQNRAFESVEDDRAGRSRLEKQETKRHSKPICEKTACARTQEGESQV
jgi:hypothetical protein